MDPIILVLALVTFVSTIIGGSVILRFKDKLPFFFAFAAGSLIAVAFFDILPEAINTAENIGVSIRYIMMTIVGAFILYHIVEKFFLTHQHANGKGKDHGHVMGPIGAGSLVVHSFLDGVAIGAAFQIDLAVGIVVALAVIFHDFTDGINTVTLMLKNRHHAKRAIMFLLADALAPVLGVLSTSLISIGPKALVIILAAFVGEFLYIGASTLLPEVQRDPSKKLILWTVGGILLIFGVTSVL